MIPLFDIATLAGYRRCYFVLRADHASKPGGDVDLARQIGRIASAQGAAISIVGVGDLPTALDTKDLLILFNINRPHEASLALNSVNDAGRVLLYSLHHPQAGVAKYISRVRGTKRLLGMLAGQRPDRYEALVDAAKAAQMRDIRRLRSAVSRDRVITRLIERCELLVTSEAELYEIGELYGVPPRGAWLFPHPVTPYAPANGFTLPRYVLVPGRIEPRKNQLAALQTLTAMAVRDRGYEIVLAGGKGADAGYFRATLDFALANGIIYVSQLPKALFFPAVSGAALVINASFFEVTSLIDLYAIENHIRLVTTIHGYYGTGPDLQQVDPMTWGPSREGPAVAAVEAMLSGSSVNDVKDAR